MLLLRQLLREPGTPPSVAAYEAGAASVLLSVLETHVARAEVASIAMSVLLQSGPRDEHILTAAGELTSPAALLRVVSDAHTALVKAAATAAGSGASAAARRAPLTIDTIVADATAQQATTIVSQALVLLQRWASTPALARCILPGGAGTLAGLVAPGAPGSLFTDSDVVEAVIEVVTVAAAVAPDVCTSLAVPPAAAVALASSAAAAGGAPSASPSSSSRPPASVLSLLASVPRSTALLDRPSVVRHMVSLAKTLAGSGPAVSMAVLRANGHAALQAAAVHWAVRAPPPPEARALYDACGDALRALLAASEPLRVAAAVADARVRLEAEAPALPESADDKARAAARKKFGASLAALQREAAKAERSAQREAATLAYAASKRATLAAAAAAGESGAPPALPPPLSAADVLERRAGLVPWDLFPRDTIGALVQHDGLQLGVWFLPGMHESGKSKLRRMTVTVTPDLHSLRYAYESKHHKRTLEWVVPLGTVGGDPRVGVAKDMGKRKLFGPAPKDSRGICLDAAAPAGGDSNAATGATLLHLEASSAEEHATLLRTLAVLAQYARARDGGHVPEPLPEVPVNLAELYASPSFGGTGGDLPAGDDGADGDDAATPALAPDAQIIDYAAPAVGTAAAVAGSGTLVPSPATRPNSLRAIGSFLRRSTRGQQAQ
jgi:hypothetical protein